MPETIHDGADEGRDHGDVAEDASEGKVLEATQQHEGKHNREEHDEKGASVVVFRNLRDGSGDEVDVSHVDSDRGCDDAAQRRPAQDAAKPPRKTRRDDFRVGESATHIVLCASERFIGGLICD